jgi:hypothetical protein
MLNNSQVPPPPPPSPKRKTKATQIIPAIIIIVSIVGALYFSGFLDVSVQTPGVLTPTRDIVGTWKTPFLTKFNIATDFESFEGVYIQLDFWVLNVVLGK